MTSSSILVVAPTKRELGGLREADARAAVRRTDHEAAPQVRIALCGIGQDAGERVAALLDAAPCSLLASLGFAGALDPALRPGDLIVADAFLRAGAPSLALPDSLSLLEESDPLSLQGERAGERVLETQEERGVDRAAPRRYSLQRPLHNFRLPSPAPSPQSSPLIGRGGKSDADSLSLQGERTGERVLETQEERGVDGAPSPSRSTLTRRFAAPSPLIGRGGMREADALSLQERAGERVLETQEERGRLPPALAGAVLTVDAPLLTPAAKRRARAASGAIAVDMEGRRIAEAAAERGVPLVAVRAALDEAGFALPACAAEIAAAGGHDERARAFRAAANPREAAGMLLLALRARKAARSLRRAADAILAAAPERL